MILSNRLSIAMLALSMYSSTSNISMTNAFAPQPFAQTHALSSAASASSVNNRYYYLNINSSSTSLLAKKGKKSKAKSKGFGKQQQVELEQMDESSQMESSSSTTSTSSAPSTTQYETTSSKNYGAEALDRLRRQKVEDRNEELRQIRDLKSVDKLLTNEPDAAVIPEQVAQRMGKRMLPFVGLPLFGVMGAFVVFWYLATYKNYEFQPALVAFSTIGILGAGLLGITYSVMSASWDVDTEGSALGVDEFQKNLGSIRDGLKRTRANAILREKMEGVPDEEIDSALDRLDKKEQADKVKKMTLEDKLKNELE